MANGDQANSKSVLQRVEDALNELLTLKIKTLVVPLNVDKGDDGDWDVSPANASEVQGFVTEIRLEQGDVVNYMSPGALENASMATFHSQQVTMSRQIVADNLKAVLELARSVSR